MSGCAECRHMAMNITIEEAHLGGMAYRASRMEEGARRTALINGIAKSKELIAQYRRTQALHEPSCEVSR